jgi:predicted ATPase
MQIMALRLKRFKSFVDEEFWPTAGVTVLVGRNNSGKSSLIDAIRLFREAADRGPVPVEAFVERGGLGRLGFRGMGQMEIELEAALEPPELSKLADPIPRSREPVIVQLAIDGGKMRTSAGIKSRSPFNIQEWGLISRAEESFDGKVLREHLSRIYYLGPRRAKPEDMTTVRGETDLDPDAANVLRVLNSLAAADRLMFLRVVQQTQRILPEVSDILAPLVRSQAMAQGIVREFGLRDYDLFWSNVADGSRQIVVLVTFLLTTPPGSVLLLEEPEMSLHPHAALKIIEVMRTAANADHKQIIFSTHSPVMVEACGLPSVRLVVRSPGGESHIWEIDDAKKIEGVLADRGVLRSFMLTPHQPGVVPRFQLIVEGKDDTAIWDKWLENAGIRAPDAVVIRADGEGEAKKLAVFLKFLRDSGFAETPSLLVVDGGSDPRAKHTALSGMLGQNDFHILSQSEIDDYLVDADAIAAVLGVEIPKVQQAIASVGGQGKPRLKAILRKLGHKDAGTEVKALIANAMDHPPKEMEEIINRIRLVLK